MVIIPGSAVSFGVQFNASASQGTPALDSYALQFFDGPTSIDIRNVGLPTPVAGVIKVTTPTAGLPRNKSLTVLIQLIGVGGTTLSPLSDPFVFVDAPINIAAPIILVS